MKLCMIGFGDMRDTLQRFAAGLPETYRAQRYSVGFIQEQAKRAQNVAVICSEAAERYHERRDGLELVGLKLLTEDGPDVLPKTLDMLSPTHILLRSPMVPALDWAKKNGANVFPIFADSFSSNEKGLRRLRQLWRQRRLVKALNDPRIGVVSNHNVAACRDLAKIGVETGKIIPWDWPHPKSPQDFAPKALGAAPYSLIYAGGVHEPKGVGDIIRAFNNSDWMRNNARLTVIGSGKVDHFRAMAEQHGLAEAITFTGRIPNEDVLTAMRDASLVLVPSHHAYAEGLPGTIYEALTVRTPLILTDHPMFVAYFTDGQGVRFVPEREPAAMASTIESLLTDADGYASLSEKTADGFASIQCPHQWHELVEHWLNDDREGYLARHKGKWAEALALS